jgi:cytochrome c-type biogenesis protein CcmF
MIIEIGHFSVIVALVLSVFGMASAALALKTRNSDWARSGRMAVTLIFVLLSIGMLSLVYSFIVRDFSVLYVANNSNSKLPFFYTVSAVWGGHEGSLLLWVFILSVFSTLAVWLHWHTQPTIMPYLIAVECAIIFGFLCLWMAKISIRYYRTRPWSCIPPCCTWAMSAFPFLFPLPWRPYSQAD